MKTLPKYWVVEKTKEYEVSLTVATIKIGCVEDITLTQAKELYNYTKTL